MFPSLPALEIDEDVLRARARSGSTMDLAARAREDPAGDNARIPADWRPTLPGRRAGEFTMADLLAFACTA